MVPQYEELTADKMYSKVKGYIDKLAEYFPDYDESFIPPRKYFWDIFSTLNQELAGRFINHFIKEKQAESYSRK